MNALARMLAEMEADDGAPKGLPEAQIERLIEVAARIAAGNTFKVGDLVTVREDAPMKGAGKPHLVVAIDADAPLYQGDPGSWSFSVRSDVIVLSVHGDAIVSHAVPFWMLEAYSVEG